MHLKVYGAALALCVLPMTALAQSAVPEQATQETRAKFRAACAADVQKFCANVERAKGAMRVCLDTAVGRLQGRQSRTRRRQGQGQELNSSENWQWKAGAGPPRPGIFCVSHAGTGASRRRSR